MISTNCLNLIKKWEGRRLTAYLDAAGIPTIGYGTTRYPNNQKVRLGDKISQIEAEAYLNLTCIDLAARINKLVTVPLNQNQLDALVSFCYNVGISAFSSSTMRKLLNAKDYRGAANEFSRWTKATVNGKKVDLPGLVNRRREERSLFLA